VVDKATATHGTAEPNEPERARRDYDNTLRRQRAGETRERIVTAGIELLKHASIRDWQGVTIRAVAERAGIHETTVYRNFVNERGLRDAIMDRLEEQSGIHVEELRLEDLPDTAARIVRTISSHPMEPHPPLDPTLMKASQRQRASLLHALEDHTKQWTESEQTIAAAMISALWDLATYEHLSLDWDLKTDQAISGVSWVIQLIEQAIRSDRRPPDAIAAEGGSEDAPNS
jgi:AcrR family transcriptional regulator